MRKVLLLSLCGLVFNVVVLAALYVRDPSYAGAVFWLPFIPAFLTFGSALLSSTKAGWAGWSGTGSGIRSSCCPAGCRSGWGCCWWLLSRPR